MTDKLFSVTKVNDNINLLQNHRGLTFGTDALLLAAFVKKRKNSIAVEIGGGSGIISLLCASRGKFSEIISLEVQPDYADIIAENIKMNSLDGIVKSVCCDVRDYVGNANTVFTNPPYMKATSGKRNSDEGKYIARHEVYGTIVDFCEAAGRILNTGGEFYCVYRPDRLCDLFCAMRDADIEPKKIVMVYPDVHHEACLVLCEGKKDAKSGLEYETLYINEPDGITMTGKMKYIYDNGNFYNEKKDGNHSDE